MEIKGSRILVTGGTGCIGREVLAYLEAENPTEIIVIGRKKNQEYNDNEKIKYASGDISDYKFMEEQLMNIDFLIHLAAKVHSIPGNKKEEEEFYEINARASEAIFKISLKQNIKKIVFMSSVAVFGDKGDNAVTEDYSCNPTTPYGKSKLFAEKFLIKLNKENKLPMTILRPTTVFGKLDKGNIANLIKLLKKGLGIVIAKGNNKKSFVYSKDIARAVIESIKNDTTSGQVYIISGFSMSVVQFLKITKSIFNTKSCTISIPLFIIDIINKINNRVYLKLKALGGTNIYDASKFINETGFRVQYDLEAGLSDSYEYYKPL